jgi:energy-coupling factor transporter ATP-binding protein EcfA2
MTVVIADHDGYLHPYIARRVLYLEDGKLADRPSRMPSSMRALALTLEASRTQPPPPEDDAQDDAQDDEL